MNFYPNMPLPNQMPFSNVPNMIDNGMNYMNYMNDMFNKFNEFENRIKKLESRISRLENNYHKNYNYNEPDNSLYMI